VQASNRITVLNNGDGVPVEMHKEENVYVPELIFGHLLTSSNYNDDEKKVRVQDVGMGWGCMITPSPLMPASQNRVSDGICVSMCPRHVRKWENIPHAHAFVQSGLPSSSNTS
jgi:hypothetical protein